MNEFKRWIENAKQYTISLLISGTSSIKPTQKLATLLFRLYNHLIIITV